MSILGRYITMRGGNIIGTPPSNVPLPLLLDTYPAAAAYSLRKLRTAYTGAAIRVRRSSDNAEQDVGFSAGVLDTVSLLSFVGAGNGFVVTWYDQSGTGADATRAVVASQQPKIVTYGTVEEKNLKPAILFDGSDDRLVTVAGVPALNTGNEFSIFHVHSSNLLNTIRNVWSTIAVGGTNQIRGFGDTRNIAGQANWFMNNAAGTNYTVTMSTIRNNTDQRLQASIMDSGNIMRGFDNGVTGGTATYTGTYLNNVLQMGSGNNGTINGYMQEFIVFDTNQLSNRTTIETDINSYYAIY
jgi:hypothetical protein